MYTLNKTTKNFKGRHFDAELILLYVRWYVTYKLSYRNLVEMKTGCGIELTHQLRKEKRRRLFNKPNRGASEIPWVTLLTAQD